MSNVYISKRGLWLKYGALNNSGVAPSRGLISYWPGTMNGSTVIDLVGGRNGAAVNVTTIPGKEGNALYFNGSAYVDFSAFTFSGAGTLAFWVYPLGVASDIGGYSAPCLYQFFDGHVVGFSSTNHITHYKYNDYTRSWFMTFNEWHLFVMRRDASNLIYYYVDNNYMGAGTMSSGFGISRLGRAYWNGGWRYGNAYLNHVRLYNVYLTDAECSQLWNNGLGV